jgi:hypothetical protein
VWWWGVLLVCFCLSAKKHAEERRKRREKMEKIDSSVTMRYFTEGLEELEQQRMRLLNFEEEYRKLKANLELLPNKITQQGLVQHKTQSTV